MPMGFDEFLSGWGDPADPRNLLRLAAIQAGTPLQPVVQRDPVMPPLPPEPTMPPERDPSLLIPPNVVRTTRIGPDGNPIGAPPPPAMPPTLPSVGPTTPRDPEKLVPTAPETFDPAPVAGKVAEVTRPILGSPDERVATPSTADSYLASAQKAMQNKQFNQALADIAKAFPARKPIGDFGAMPTAPQVAKGSSADPGAAGRGTATAMMSKIAEGLKQNRAGIITAGKKRPPGFGKNIDFGKGR